jgi:integrase
VLRQAVAKIVKQAGKTAGISADLGTHTGRRTVVTTLFVDGDEALEDIARFVGHARPATTAGYVKRLGRRPRAVAQRAAAILDADDRQVDDTPTRVRIHPGEGGSNAESNRGARSDQPQPDGGP